MPNKKFLLSNEQSSFHYRSNELKLFSLRSNNSGFTLIELLVVIVVLATVVWVALPNVRKFNQGQGLKEDVNKVLYDLRLVQSNAQSGVKCNQGTGASRSWGFRVNNIDTDRYNILNDCDITTETSFSIRELNNSNITPLCDSNDGDSNDAPIPATIRFDSITFNQVGISYPGCSPSETFFVKLVNRNDASEANCIKIDRGGAFYEETCP